MKSLPIALVLALSLLAPAARAQDGNRYGPWDRDLYVLESADGLKFGAPKLFVERAGVPCVVRMDSGRLVAVFQWFPIDQPKAFDRVGVCFSDDGGKTWSAPESIVVEGFPGDLERPYDPTLVPLADGRLRILYTSRNVRDRGDWQATWSAVSSDGRTWTFEPEARVRVPGQMVIDCAAVRRGSTWHWFAPVQGQDGSGFHAVSSDGLTFERRAGVELDGPYAWLGNVVDTGDGFRFYGSGHGGIWSAFSKDAENWTLDPGSRAKGGDPAVVKVADGRWLMVLTGDLRADAGSPLPAGVRGQGGGPPPGAAAGGPGASSQPSGPAVLGTDGTSLFLFVGGKLTRIDPERMQKAGEVSLPVGKSGMPGQDSGPSGHRLLAARSQDGLTWTAEGHTIKEPASVPDALVGPDGRTRIWFVDPEHQGVSVGVEAKDGTWEFARTNLRGCDPNVILLEDGTYRAFTKDGIEECRIVRADSKDGVTFGKPEPAFEDAEYPNMTDSDVFRAADGWVMYVSLGPRLLLAESPDGKTFRAVRMLDLGGSVCDTVAVEGGWRLFFHKNGDRSADGRMSIWSAFSKDGRDWKVESCRLKASADGPDRLGVGDPAVVRLADGTWRMFYKSFR